MFFSKYFFFCLSLKHPLIWSQSTGTLYSPKEQLKNAKTRNLQLSFNPYLPRKVKSPTRPKTIRKNKSESKPHTESWLPQEFIPASLSGHHLITHLIRRLRKVKKNHGSSGKREHGYQFFFCSASIWMFTKQYQWEWLHSHIQHGKGLKTKDWGQVIKGLGNQLWG